jgi:hypothetical protein
LFAPLLLLVAYCIDVCGAGAISLGWIEQTVVHWNRPGTYLPGDG